MWKETVTEIALFLFLNRTQKKKKRIFLSAGFMEYPSLVWFLCLIAYQLSLVAIFIEGH